MRCNYAGGARVYEATELHRDTEEARRAGVLCDLEKGGERDGTLRITVDGIKVTYEEGRCYSDGDLHSEAVGR